MLCGNIRKTQKALREGLPVAFIGVQGLIAGLIAANSLHEVVHSFCRVAVSVIRAGDFHFL